MEVLAGDDGRVFKLLDGGGGVVGGGAAGWSVVASSTPVVRELRSGGSERGADAPAGGDGDGGLDGDVFDGDVGGVEEELLPFEDGELLADAGGDDAVEMRVQGGDAGGDGDVVLVEVRRRRDARGGFGRWR